MSNFSKFTVAQLRATIELFEKKLVIIPEGEDKEYCLIGLRNYQNELKSRLEKKSAQSEPKPKESNRQEFFKKQAQEYRESGHDRLADKVEQEVQNAHRDQAETAESFDQRIEWEKRDGVNATFTAPQPQIKTVKALDFDDDLNQLINVTLTNSKGQFVRKHTKAQVKALCRKYFGNVLETRINGNTKLGLGFKNLVSYFLAWVELDLSAPELKEVLQDYGKYKRGENGSEASSAFKIAQQLYDKLISVTSKEEKDEN